MKTIPLSDPRFAAIALASTPVIDAEPLIDVVTPAGAIAVVPVIPKGVPEVRRDGDKAYFKTSDTAEIAVHIENETLVFFPLRSSAHRQLLAKLGIDE